MMVYSQEKEKIERGNLLFLKDKLVSCSIEALENIYGFLSDMMGDMVDGGPEISYNEETNKLVISFSDDEKTIDCKELLLELRDELRTDNNYETILDMFLGDEKIIIANYLGVTEEGNNTDLENREKTSLLEDILIKMLFEK